MFAKRRYLRVPGSPPLKTPILLPSFSSKGFPKVGKILQTMEEFISDEVLVSAYDLHYKKVEPSFDFATVLFVDSGGYEASKDVELSEIYEGGHVPQEWSPELHVETLNQIETNTPTVIVSFDHPDHRCSISDQIAKAKDLPINGKNQGKSLLIKPETKKSIRVKVASVVAEVPKMHDFSTIGLTEKEIGKSVFDRMRNIAEIRREVDKHHDAIPIHVFGALDTISTYLYFLAGADIFDGLSWLRYAFVDGDTIYRHQFGTTNFPITTPSDVVEAACWSNNYQYMQTMRLNMARYAMDGDFKHFGKYHSFIKEAYDNVRADLGDI